MGFIGVLLGCFVGVSVVGVCAVGVAVAAMSAVGLSVVGVSVVGVAAVRVSAVGSGSGRPGHHVGAPRQRRWIGHRGAVHGVGAFQAAGDQQPAAVRGGLQHREVPWPAAESDALGLGDRLLGRPEAGEPQLLRIGTVRRRGAQQPEFLRAERGGEGRRIAPGDLFDVDAGAGMRGVRPYDRHGRLGAVGERDVQRGQGAAVHPGDVRSPQLVVADAQFGREDGAFAVLPQPLPYGVLGGDPAQQPLPAAARRTFGVLGAFGAAERVAHDQLA
ncbi:hypothetical protein BFF78_35145 [Streptomyces fodineus]|uniref:Uncharacterized protein n=1 Tax=Streptomyces fodineus TaxID=1904616 RepID=A0A1D7YJ97_9ACTN|nr:hypothetical protein BFF78_35145 [Streptomyces fodineus]